MNQTVSRKQYLIAALIVFIGAIGFSTKAIFVKLAYQYGIDSLSLSNLRMLFSFPFYLGVAIWSIKNQTTDAYQLTQKDYRNIFILGLMGYYIASFLDFLGLQYIDASLERIILYLYPTLVLIISAIFFRKKIKPIHVLALLLTYVGVGFAFLDNLGVEGQKDLIKGGILVFSAAISYAIYLVGSGEILPKIGTLRYNSISMMMACCAVFLHNGIMNGLDIFNFPMPVYWLSMAMALFATVIPTFMIAEGIRIIGSANASIIGSIGPISTIMLAYILLGERLGNWQWVGTLFVIAGVMLITLQKRSSRNEK